LGVKTYKSSNWKNIIKGLSGHSEDDDRDFYIYPATFHRPTNPTGSNCAGAGFVWADCDGNSPTWDQSPTVTIETSPDHYHFYWKLTTFQSPKTIEAINRPIAYKYNLDKSGWDCSQLLRPPGSYNRKRDNFQSRIVGWYPDHILDPEIQETAGTPEPQQVPDIHRILANLVPTGKINKFLFDPFTGTDRSKFLYSGACLLIEHGCKDSEIIALLQHRDLSLKKATDRVDPEDYYKNLVSNARTKLSRPEPGIQKGTQFFQLFETPTEFLTRPKTTTERFVIDDLLPYQGMLLIAGTPGCGKSTFLSHMLLSVATGTTFIGKKIVEPKRTLFFSLEMPKPEVEDIWGKQLHHFPDNDNLKLLTGSSGIDLTQREYQIEIENYIKEHQIEVVGVDTLQKCVPNLNDGEIATKLFNWFQSLNLTWIVITHTRKNPASSKNANYDIDSPTGSRIWTANCSIYLLMQRFQTGEADFTTEKSRSDSIPDKWQIRYDKATKLFSTKQTKQIENDNKDQFPL
jgi:hypothetical protein